MGTATSRHAVNLVLPDGRYVLFEEPMTVDEVLKHFPDHFITAAPNGTSSAGIPRLPPQKVLRVGRTYFLRPYLQRSNSPVDWEQSEDFDAFLEEIRRQPKVPSKPFIFSPQSCSPQSFSGPLSPTSTNLQSDFRVPKKRRPRPGRAKSVRSSSSSSSSNTSPFDSAVEGQPAEGQVFSPNSPLPALRDAQVVANLRRTSKDVKARPTRPSSSEGLSLFTFFISHKTRPSAVQAQGVEVAGKGNGEIQSQHGGDLEEGKDDKDDELEEFLKAVENVQKRGVEAIPVKAKLKWKPPLESIAEGVVAEEEEEETVPVHVVCV